MMMDNNNSDNNDNNISLNENIDNSVSTQKIEDKFKNSTNIEVFYSKDEVVFVPQNVFTKYQPATKQASSVFEFNKDEVWKDEAIEFPTELPQSISCTPFLKAVISCYSPSGIMRNLYRFGEFKCDVESENFRDCTLISITSSAKRQAELDKVLKRRQEQKDQFVSNHVWKERKQPIDNEYFGYNIDLINFINKSPDYKSIDTVKRPKSNDKDIDTSQPDNNKNNN